MRRALVLVSFVALTAAVSACDSCEKKNSSSESTGTAPTASPSVSASATPSAAPSASASASSPDAGAKRDMSNCPTAVAGADVAIKDVDGGVEVAVTGKDDATSTDIRARMKKLSELARSDAGPGRHDHSGSGGGTTGRCTIVMRNTKLVTAEIPHGAKVTVTPLDKAELDWLRRETKERDKEAKSVGAEGMGAMRMAHCPSAVEGAKTVVTDAKDGVVVTVTGPADKVDEIRQRAKHTADVAKKLTGGPEAGPKVEHSGSGTGGGALGHCPIVVEGDTTVDVKDVAGGAAITVKTKGDAAALQKEAKLRAGNFH